MPDNYEAHIDLSRLEVSCNHQINIPDKYHIQKVQEASYPQILRKWFHHKCFLASNPSLNT